MLVIGLTGGIGSGKTTVANLFAQEGVPIIDADIISKKLTETNTPSYTKIVNHFGKEILTSDGSLNRKKLREIIFSHPEERLWLENLLHPLILQRMQELIHQLNVPYCIAIIPLLIEKGSYPFIHRILVVDSPLQLQINRVEERDLLARSIIESIINTQIKREERLARANDIIVNDSSLEHLQNQVKSLHKMYLQIAQNS